MTDRELYTLTIPADSQTSAQTQAKRNTSARGVLGEDSGFVKSLSTEPDKQTLRGQFRGTYAELMATELSELFDSDSEAVSYAGTAASTPADGYYTPEEISVRRLDPRDDAIVAFEGRMTRVGTRNSHRRAVQTTSRQVDHPFGNTERTRVGIPAAATDVRWLESVSKTTETATPVTTRIGEFGRIDVYDVFDSTYNDPTLVYDLPYDEVGQRDVRVWDDYGRSEHDADGVNRWQKVFRTDHDWVGSPRLDNSRVRLQFDTAANSLSAETWDPSSSAWTAEALGTSDWELAAVDVQAISSVQVRARVRFQDPTQSPTATYGLTCLLVRGTNGPLWTRPENETDPVPAGLVDLLTPIASANDYEPQPVQTLVARSEVDT